MPRKATGSIRWRNGVAYARVTLGPGDRPGIALPTCRTQGEAEARQVILADLATKLRRAGHVDAAMRKAGQVDLAMQFLQRAATRDGKALEDVCGAVDRLCAGQPIRIGLGDGSETFKTFAEKWTKNELHQLYPDHIKAKRSVDDDKYRLKKLYDLIGDVPLTRFTLDDAERAMRLLPEGLSSASRRHYAQIMHRVLGMAVFPARIIAANPLPRGFLPSVKNAKALTYLYPAEDAQLLAASGAPAGETEAERAGVPLCYRVLYGFLAREGMRTGEAEGLRWSDITWTNDGVAAVTLDENKTDSPRAWTLSPGVSRALELWLELTPAPEDDDHVFVDEFDRPMSRDRLAETLREHLALAKVTRKQLFETSKARRPIRAHDLRATFITVALASGRSETWVMDRTGHETSAMLARYRRASRSFAELGLGDLVPLDQAIPELVALAKELAANPTKRARKRARIVGQEGLEPSANGLRVLPGGADEGQPVGSAEEPQLEIARVTTPGPASEALGPNSTDAVDVVESALAYAIRKATDAGEWDRVTQLAKELEARRLARSAPNVVPIGRKSKEGPR